MFQKVNSIELKKVNVIDLGSSSVRYMQVAGGEIFQKKSRVTRLAEGKKDGYLCKESMLRTISAVKDFVQEARLFGGEIYIFATASVRNSLNGKEFALLLTDVVGINVDILSGEQEAEVGLLGALKGKDGGVIDIGGASSEIIVAKNGVISYEKSLPLGGVILKNLSQSSIEEARKIVKEQISFYGQVPPSNFYGIGGTVTCLVAVVLGLKEYNRNVVHGFKLTREQIFSAEDFLLTHTPDEVSRLTCVSLQRAEILPFGVQILKEIFNILQLEEIIVSESDNLEGYLLKKGGLNYEKG